MTPNKPSENFSGFLRVTDKRGKGSPSAVGQGAEVEGSTLEATPSPLIAREQLSPEVRAAMESLKPLLLGDKFYQGDFIWEVSAVMADHLQIKPLALTPSAAKKMRRVIERNK